MSIKRYPPGGGPTGGTSTIAGAEDFNGTGAAVGQLVAVAQASGGHPTGFEVLDPADLPVSDTTQAAFDGLALAQWASAPGVDPTGATDSTVALQAFLAAAGSARRYSNVALRPGTYRIDGGLTIDYARVGLVGLLGGVTLDASQLPAGGTALTVASSASNAAQTDPQAQLLIGGFQLIGPGKTSDSTGIHFHQAPGGGAIIGALRGLGVTKFGVGHKYGSNAYTITHMNSNVGECATAISAPNGVGNGGERIGYIGSTIFNSTVGVSAQNSIGEFMFSCCSLDYNDTLLAINDSLVYLHGCHVEKSIANSSRWITLAGNRGSLVMQGGSLVATGTPSAGSPDYILQNDTPEGPGAIFRDVYMNNLVPTTGDFATGAGYTRLEALRGNGGNGGFFSVGAAQNLLADGGFEQATVYDQWFVSADTATITSPLTGANITISTATTTPRTGVRSLRLNKLGAGGNAGGSLVVPIRAATFPRFRFYLSKPGAETGTVIARVLFALVRVDGNGVPRIIKSEAASGTGTFNLTSTPMDWTAFTNGTPGQRSPEWATHLWIEFNLNSFVGPGSIYVDDVAVTSS